MITDYPYIPESLDSITPISADLCGFRRCLWSRDMGVQLLGGFAAQMHVGWSALLPLRRSSSCRSSTCWASLGDVGGPGSGVATS